MFTISKRFDFSASHVLHGLPDNHPCSRLHGHNYSVELLLAGEADERGFVFDYRDLDMFKRWVDNTLDHRHLNDVFPDQPSAENLAAWIFDVAKSLGIPGLACVRLKETDKTMAEYRP